MLSTYYCISIESASSRSCASSYYVLTTRFTAQGQQGDMGRPGTAGKNGHPGPKGPNGVKGFPGETGEPVSSKRHFVGYSLTSRRNGWQYYYRMPTKTLKNVNVR